ncbi:Glucose-6-phosphate dehydrogenase domain protein [Theileria parva strain Muguga]|uniref:glucose-6-phosphate dehydrogenase (NADP(+)) n=1 Tax=Theileria parva TaxID=5875 RepID=Q4MZ87_THEPA|nr:Glucose-6-phosphate dehydrogenase domain protein [Theileria parva strain Muguga]EAN31303.1 Glucose-6-phosphate dehydrogenase domain protein [Theileria parva strain Muguga]|eukprot:XP_763586.1 glucose-6-phosphate dehydrogenase-6-phosphogluconolactonase [Theileria parva strain Muguga]
MKTEKVLSFEESVPEKLYKRVFKTLSTMDSYASFSTINSNICSDYNSWLKSFYSSKINDFLDFQNTSHILNANGEVFDEYDDVLFEPCLLDCHTEEGFVLTASHLILHKIRRKLAKSPDTTVKIGLSGGHTPRGIYRFLGSMKDLDLDFNRIIFFLVDERYVPSDDEMSNLRLLRNTLLKHWPIPESNLIFPDTSLPLEECIKKYEADLEEIFGVVTTHPNSTKEPYPGGNLVGKGEMVSTEFESFDHSYYKPKYSSVPDLVTLGIGEDFHIAGLFPEYLSTLDSAYVTDSLHRVMATYTETTVVRERISCSLPFLSCARTKLFFLKGERKKRIWNTMLEYKHYDPIRFPATQIFTKPGCIAVLDSSTIRKVRIKVPIDQNDFLTFILFGSGGDLARRKIYPALFHLFYLGFLPNKFHILAISRSHCDFEEFFSQISNDIFSSITTNIFMRNPAVRFDFPSVITEFKSRCSRICLRYDDSSFFERFKKTLREIEHNSETSHRMVYLATPSEAYQNILRVVTSCCKPENGWFRVMLEKPFGRDLQSCEEIDRFLNKHVAPDEAFLVDHYLGKPVVGCILSTKIGSNYARIFNRRYIKSVHILLKEEIGSFGREYFESYGIIRDMIQNHGMQLLSLIAMQCPNKKYLHQNKYTTLKCVRTVTLDDLVIGQYGESEKGCSYRDEKGVPKDSLCATYCTVVLWIDNEYWRGVPFVITSGKGLDDKLVEIRLSLKRDPPVDTCYEFTPTHLVYRIQPVPSVFWRKDCTEVKVRDFNDPFSYDFENEKIFNTEEKILVDVESSAAKRTIEGAYELLFFNAFSNKRDLFPTIQQVNEAWRIFTPVLHEIAEKKIEPFLYPRGSQGPKEADDLLSIL